MQLDFWFEFASTYSYPAAMRIESLAGERGVAVAWRALLLGPIFHEQGWDDSPFNIYPVKGRYMWRDLERICQAHGIALKRPSQFPRNGLWAARVSARFADEPWLPEFVRSVYRANFADDLDIASEDTLTRCLEPLVDDPARVLEEAKSTGSKQLLRDRTEQAAGLGIFGAPSFVVGDELFWGHDRLEEALAWASDRG